jgi:hypothetical protein
LLVKYLTDHVLGKRELSASQVTAALGLIRKVVADKTETKADITVRKAESMHEEQARLLAESYIEARRVASAGAAASDPVHSSVSTGLPAR